jgi:hypothetical protein
MAKTNTVARLEIVVEYEEIPDGAEIESIVESCRGLGHVTKADLQFLQPCIKSFK